MSFLLDLYRQKLASMQAAAPRATLRAFHAADGFELYLQEAEMAAFAGGQLTNKTCDPDLDPSVWHLAIPLDRMPAFTEAVTAKHTLALVDKKPDGRFVAYAWFNRKPAYAGMDTTYGSLGVTLEKPENAPQQKEPSADFWG